jgi:hypothetical protein
VSEDGERRPAVRRGATASGGACNREQVSLESTRFRGQAAPSWHGGDVGEDVNRDNLLKLTKNEWLQEVSSKSRLVWDAGAVVFVLAYVIRAFVYVHTEDYASSPLLPVLVNRFPGYDELILARFAVADTVFPALMTLLAALWPGSRTTMSMTREKDKKTLECLLLIPVSKKEVLCAKVASAALPAVIVTWLVYGVTVFAAAGFMSTELGSYLLNSRLLTVALFSVPVLAVLSAFGGIVVSISVADSKTALSLGFLPGTVGTACFALVHLANITFSTMFVLLVTLLLAGLGVVMLGVAASRFDRERILLRFS